MKQFLILLFTIFLTSCNSEVESRKNSALHNPDRSDSEIKERIDSRLDEWHQAAAEANFGTYFELMSKEGVFLGTDASENWQNQQFKEFSKPYFDQGKAWDFTAIERNIYIGESKQYAWFDEILDTHMGLCRGSGVLEREENKWKVKHYVLSILIPNDKVKEVTELKKDFDTDFLDNF
jgi:hypothetical protein